METEHELASIGFNSPRYCSGGLYDNIMGWDFIDGEKHGFIIIGTSIFYFTGAGYSFFNAYIRFNNKHYILAEFNRRENSNSNSAGSGQISLHIKQKLSKNNTILMEYPTQCSVVMCLSMDMQLQWSRSLYLNCNCGSGSGSSVRAYGLRVRDHIVEISGSLGYSRGDQLNTDQIKIPVDTPSNVYGFVASFSNIGWLTISLEPDTNITDLHSMGYVVKNVRHYEDSCLDTNMECYDGCGCYYHIYVDNTRIHDIPINTDMCGDYILMRTNRKTWIYDMITESKSILAHPVNCYRELNSGILLNSSTDRNWYLCSREHYPIIIEPEYDWNFFTVTSEQLQPTNTNTNTSINEGKRVLHIHIK